MKIARAIPVLLILSVGLAGCAAGGTTSSRSSANVLTRVELTETGASTMYDAINRLRPRWLTIRGGRSLSVLSTEVVVYQNQTYIGDVEVLRQLAPNMAERVRYMDGATASASLPGIGSRHIEAAIVLETSAAR